MVSFANRIALPQVFGATHETALRKALVIGNLLQPDNEHVALRSAIQQAEALASERALQPKNRLRHNLSRLVLDVGENSSYTAPNSSLPMKRGHVLRLGNFTHAVLFDSHVVDPSRPHSSPRETRLHLFSMEAEPGKAEPTSFCMPAMLSDALTSDKTPVRLFTGPDMPPALIHEEDVFYSRTSRRKALNPTETVGAVAKDFGDEAVQHLSEEACGTLMEIIHNSTHLVNTVPPQNNAHWTTELLK